MKPTRRNFIVRSLGALAALIPGASLFAKEKQPWPGYIAWGPKTLLRTVYAWRCINSHVPWFAPDGLKRKLAPDGKTLNLSVENWAWIVCRMQDLKIGEQFVLVNPDGSLYECAGAPAVFVVTGPAFMKDGVQDIEADWWCEFDPEQFDPEQLADIGAETILR